MLNTPLCFEDPKAVYKEVPAAGDFICFRETAKQRRAYGIMALPLLPIETSGTYIMHGAGDLAAGGLLQTIARTDLHVAWLRLNNHDPSNHYSKDCPEEELQIMYATHLSNPVKFKEDIFNSQQEYEKQVREIQQLEAERKASKKAAPGKKTPKAVKVPQKCPKKVLPLGTKLAGFFLNKEVYAHATKHERARLRAIWKKSTEDPKELKKGWPNTGDWYEGFVKDTCFTKQNDILYVCIFTGPNFERTLEINYKHALELIKSYAELGVFRTSKEGSDSDDFSSSTDDEEDPKSIDRPMRGMKVRHQVKHVNHRGQCVLYNHDGTIQAERMQNSRVQFSCVFPGCTPTQAWFSFEDTLKMVHAAFAHFADVQSQKKTGGQKLHTLGQKQHNILNEATAVAQRGTGGHVAATDLGVVKADVVFPAQDTLAEEQKDWYATTLYKLINGRYVAGHITFIQYDIAVDLSRTGAYTCQFQTGTCTTVTETVPQETVVLYKANQALFTQQEALLSLVHKSAMDQNSDVKAHDNGDGTKDGSYDTEQVPAHEAAEAPAPEATPAPDPGTAT